MLVAGAFSFLLTVATWAEARSILRARGISRSLSAIPIIGWVQDINALDRVIDELDNEVLKRKYKRTTKLFYASLIGDLLIVLVMFLLVGTRRFL